MEVFVFSNQSNQSNLLPGCDGSLERPSCMLTSSQLGIWDVVAALRAVMSCLSVLGASSIIATVIRKREVTNPKIHPIFLLSLADFILAVLWIVGGALWFRSAPDRSWCFAVSLLTVILVCVTGNLTVVYALLMYSTLKKMDLFGVLSNSDHHHDHVWSPLKTILIYSTAIGLPVVIVLLLFGIIAGESGIVENANSCSCWCAPVLGNVLPYAIHRQEGTAKFVYGIRKLVATYGGVVATHFLVGFVLLLIVYYKILRWIRKMRSGFEYTGGFVTTETGGRGTTLSLIHRGESKARKRVFYFLTVFAVTGFFNFIFSFGYMIHELLMLRKGDEPRDNSDLSSASFEPFYITCATLQSLSITQQGFLNAIVYGWTRDDFLYIMSVRREGTLSAMTSSQNTPPGGYDDSEGTWIIHSDEDDYDEMITSEDEKASFHSSSKSAHSVAARRLQSRGHSSSPPPP